MPQRGVYQMIEIPCDTGEHVVIDAASLVGACLDDLNLHRAQLDEQVLTGSSMKGVNLRAASLERTVLSGCNLENAIVFGAWAKCAVFREAHCFAAKFNCAILNGADFTNADLSQADLSQTQLQGATLLGATVVGADFQSAEYDRATVWPEGFDPAASGAKLVLQ